MASLIVVEQGKKSSFELRPGQNLIGRHPDCAVEIVQASVSGKHAAIHGENGEFGGVLLLCVRAQNAGRNGIAHRRRRYRDALPAVGAQ